MSQEVLAGLVGRTVDWLSKAENNRIELDRLSVLRSLAGALGVPVSDLIGQQEGDSRGPDDDQPVTAIRAALTDYTQIGSPSYPEVGPVDLDGLRGEVGKLWDACQHARYSFATAQLPSVLVAAQGAARHCQGADRERGLKLLALTYHAAEFMLPKLGEPELAWIAADRGLAAARQTDDPVVVGSLLRSVAHALLSTGQYQPAKQVVHDTAGYLQPGLATAGPAYWSVYGTLFLAGAMASARANDRATTRSYLAEADVAARHVGQDGNHLWTSFGPTNVKIHRVATAMELGDVQIATDLGPAVDTSGLPTERRVRHALETARALNARNRTDEALSMVLNAERISPEQVRHHFVSRQLVQRWVQGRAGRPSHTLSGLAQRLHVA